MTDLQRRLIVILVLELIQSGVSGWCWWTTRGRWMRATDEHSQYVEGDEAHPPMNDGGAEILRVRVERYAGWMGIHLWYFAGGLLASLGRVITIMTVDAPGVAVTASRDLQILVGAVLMFRMMSKDDFSRKRVSRMDDAEAIRHMTVAAAADVFARQAESARSAVEAVNVKLDEMKDQQTEAAQHLEQTTTAEALAVRTRLEDATMLVGVSAEQLQDKLGEAAREVTDKASKALHSQTDTLIDTIEAAKVYTAERADAAKDASAKSEAAANHTNQKILSLEKINEKHAEMLQAILKLLQSAGVTGTEPGSPVVEEAKAVADSGDKS